MNFFSILEEAANKWPEDTAVVHDGRNFRYSELYTAAESFARELCRAGIEAGDKLGVVCPNSPEYIAVFFAAVRVGAVVLPIFPALRAAEITALAEEMTLDALCYTGLNPPILAGAVGTVTKVSIFERRTPLCIEASGQRRTAQSERERLLSLNVAAILFTSGSTSKAKGVMLSHAILLQQVKARCEGPLSIIRKDETLLCVLSMATNLVGMVAAYLLRGGKILLADATDPRPVRGLVIQHGVTHIAGPPLFYRMLHSEDGIAPKDLQDVKYFMSTGSALPDTTAELFHAKFGREILQRYGLSECGVVLANLSERRSKRGSVGTPQGGYEIELGPGDSARPGGGNGAGELWVRGPGLFDGYCKPWRLRDEVLEDGWLRTGDLARRDADGYYWIVGRVKDVINVGGVKVFPSEIEDVLLSHPAVEEVVVFSVPEARFGEVPHGKVKLRTGAVCAERELLRFANERLSVFKTLREVEFVDEIPKTVTGKPRRIG